jgi:ribosomal protein L29
VTYRGATLSATRLKRENHRLRGELARLRVQLGVAQARLAQRDREARADLRVRAEAAVAGGRRDLVIIDHTLTTCDPEGVSLHD